MNATEVAERIERLEAHVTACMAAIRALTAAHPDPARAQRVVNGHLEEFIAIALATPQPDVFANELAIAATLVVPPDALLRGTRPSR